MSKLEYKPITELSTPQSRILVLDLLNLGLDAHYEFPHVYVSVEREEDLSLVHDTLAAFDADNWVLEGGLS